MRLRRADFNSSQIQSQVCRDVAMASLDEKVKLRFLQWQGLYKEEKPFEIVTETIQGSENRRTNLLFGTNGEQTITDIRGREGTQFALDSHGFAYRPKPCPFDGYDNKQRILEEYLPWAESIIKQEIEDSGRVFIFDWRVSESWQLSAWPYPNVERPVFADGNRSYGGLTSHRGGSI